MQDAISDTPVSPYEDPPVGRLHYNDDFDPTEKRRRRGKWAEYPQKTDDVLNGMTPCVLTEKVRPRFPKEQDERFELVTRVEPDDKRLSDVLEGLASKPLCCPTTSR